jgi:hypothetical protein
MPRAKKPTATLTLSEFDKLSAAITDLLTRTRAALAESEASRDVVDRLERAGFFAGSKPTPKPAATPTANGGAKRSGKKRAVRRRHHSPIEPSTVIAAVKKTGATGATAGEIADALGIDAERLRYHLYQLRDAGTLKMVGKAGSAKYVAGKGTGAAGKRGKQAKPGASRNGTTQKAKPQKATPAAPASTGPVAA